MLGCPKEEAEQDTAMEHQKGISYGDCGRSEMGQCCLICSLRNDSGAAPELVTGL